MTQNVVSRSEPKLQTVFCITPHRECVCYALTHRWKQISNMNTFCSPADVLITNLQS